MGRPIGSKNAEYERRRADLLDAAMPRLLADQGMTSFNEIAAEVGVSVPTLRHYFKDRSGLVAAALRHQHRHGASHLARAAVPSSPDLATSLTQFLGELAQAWRVFGVGRLFAGGLAMGLRDTAAGPAYLDGILEPTLVAVEARLGAHAAAGTLALAADDAGGLRAAALSLLSPVVLALLHQDALGGAACRALDVAAYVQVHVAAFVRAYGANSAAVARTTSSRRPRTARSRPSS